MESCRERGPPGLSVTWGQWALTPKVLSPKVSREQAGRFEPGSMEKEGRTGGTEGVKSKVNEDLLWARPLVNGSLFINK